MKTIYIIIKVLLILFLFCFLVSNYSYSLALSSPIDNPDYYKPDMTPSPGSDNSFVSLSNRIIGLARFVGSAISILVLAFIGIKYMIGSLEEKSEYKKTLLPYLLGAIMVFGITVILGIAQSIIITIN